MKRFVMVALFILFTLTLVQSKSFELENIETYLISSSVVKIEYLDNKVFVANEEEGLKVYLKSDLQFENPIGILEDYVYDFEIRDDYLYVAGNINGLAIYKMIIEPNKVEFMNVFFSSFSGFLRKILLKDDHAILLSPYGDMFVMGIKDPENPEYIQHIKIHESLRISDAVILDDNILMIADEKLGLFFFKRNDEWNFKFEKKTILEKGVSDIYLYQDKVYLGNSTGIHIFTRNGYKLYEKQWIPIYLKRISDMVRDGNLIYYLGETDFGIVDVSDPENPEELYYRGMGCYTKHIEIISDLEFLICADCQALKRVKLRYAK